MVEARGLMRGTRRHRYGPGDIESIKRGRLSCRRRVGWALGVTVCLLPLGPFALLGLLALLWTREWTTFWCAFKDGRSFIGEMPSRDYDRLIAGLSAWHAGQIGVSDWLPVARRGSTARPVSFVGKARPVPVSSRAPMTGALAIAIARASEPVAAGWTPANDTAALAAGPGRLRRKPMRPPGVPPPDGSSPAGLPLGGPPSAGLSGGPSPGGPSPGGPSPGCRSPDGQSPDSQSPAASFSAAPSAAACSPADGGLAAQPLGRVPNTRPPAAASLHLVRQEGDALRANPAPPPSGRAGEDLGGRIGEAG